MTKLISFVVLLLLFFNSCTPDYYYSKEQPIQNSIWTYKDTLNFEVDIRDTTHIYNIHLDIEHTTAYAYQNIYLLIHTLFPGGQRPQQRISVDLADKSGEWQGDCNGGQCELRVNMQQGAFFNALGPHVFTIEQYMRVDSLQGINSIALRIEDTGQLR